MSGLPRPSAWCLRIVLFALLARGFALAAPPFDLVPLNPASPNHARLFSGVRIGDTVPQAEGFRAGDEMLSAVYAYLSPQSAVVGNVAYRDRLLVLMDHRLGMWDAGQSLEDIAFCWQLTYAYMLLKHHSPGDLSPERVQLYERAIARSGTRILTATPMLYEQRLLANLWLNGDIRLAMSVYFGAMALGNSADAEKARAAIDTVMCQAQLLDGGTRYVGFWGEVATYHDENVRCFTWWWKITGSTATRAALEATRLYSLVANEPSGFTEQSSNIPYKHMYNNLHNRRASLWKAYLFDDGYNYFFGASEETSTSTELLNSILYRPGLTTKTPPSNVGVFFDGNIQGPRGRWDSWGWILHGRDVQNGGPESLPLIQAQGFDGRQCGKNTFVGAFALGPIANKTSLKGAVDSVTMEFKEAAGEDPEHMRGRLYRFLTQDENTATINRRGFGTLSSTYRVSRRTSALASANWSSGATVWMGNQVWVATAERLIGIVQIVNDSQTTVNGLNARIIFTGGRRGIMGEFLTLETPDSSTFQFGEIRVKVHGKNLDGGITQERIAISDINSTDDFSALLRIHDAQVANDAPFTVPAGTRRWILLDIVRQGTAFASPVINVVPAHASYAVLQFTEGSRKVRIVQNLTGTSRNYSGNFIVGSTYASTSLHRSWTSLVSPIVPNSGTAVVADTVPPYGHMIAVNSNLPEDHTAESWTSDHLFGPIGDLADYSLGTGAPTRSFLQDGNLGIVFDRLRADVTYRVEASGDLQSWSTLETNPGTLGGPVTATDPAGLGAARFMRVTVTRPRQGRRGVCSSARR